MKFLLCLVFISYFSISLAQYDPHFDKGKTIVHLFEWKWVDIAQECENFLQSHSYGGVQVSPPNENLIVTNRPWFERYQPVSYTLVTRSGNENDFADMVQRCNSVGVRIYPDIVINHMTGGDGQGTAGNSASATNNDYPGVPYTNDDFHPTCDITNWNDSTNVRECEMDSLKDLNQSTDNVRNKIIDYLNHLIDLGVAGFRIDAAECIWPNDLEFIFNNLKPLNVDHGFPEGARAYIFQEVTDYGNQVITSSEYTPLGAVCEFKHAVNIGNAFQKNKKLADLINWGADWGFIPDNEKALIFVDNHDLQRSSDTRVLTYKNSKLYKMAIAFMLAHPYGSTRIISSYYFDEYSQSPPSESPGFNPDNTCTNGYVCEHRWSEIYNMVHFRKVVEGTDLENWWSNDDQQIAFSRGNRGFIAFTNSGNINQNLQTGLPPGTYCDVISGIIDNGKCTGNTVVVSEDGRADISLLENDFDGALAIHVDAIVKP